MIRPLSRSFGVSANGMYLDRAGPDPLVAE
jgi:hypothetical protein